MKDFEETLQLAYEQMQDDRKAIKESYAKFSEQMATLNDYAVNGININKCLELLTKQTGQLLELAKIQSAEKKKNAKPVESEEAERIYSELRSDPDGYQ